jgi:DNA-binding PadR family transcriptional regulator
MSVAMSLLAMLGERPMYGLELKHVFEERTAGVWPLNVGQVYTTVGRLERDGLVTLREEHDGQKVYETTSAGREKVAGWFGRPSKKLTASRDEMVLKIAIAMSTPWVDVATVIQAERRALIEQLQEYTRLKAAANEADDLSWLMLLDSLIFKTEARVRWLDVCESRIARAGSVPTTTSPTTSGAIAPAEQQKDEVRR